MNWKQQRGLRGSYGNLTPLAQALDAIDGNGCDCGGDEPGMCIACVCEEALRGQFEALKVYRRIMAILCVISLASIVVTGLW